MKWARQLAFDCEHRTLRCEGSLFYLTSVYIYLREDGFSVWSGGQRVCIMFASHLFSSHLAFLSLLIPGHFVLLVVLDDTALYRLLVFNSCRFTLIAADAAAARSILVFKHDEDKVNNNHSSFSVIDACLSGFFN